MPNENGALTQTAIVNAVITASRYPKDSTTAFMAAGQHRRKASETEKFSRKVYIDSRHDFRTSRMNEEPIRIIPSDKEEAMTMEIEPILLGTILTTESWKTSFLQTYYNLEDKSELSARFPTDQDINHAIDEIHENVGEYNFYSFISHHIKDRIDREVKKDKHQSKGNVTVGLEIEVGQALTFTENEEQERLKQTKKIDILQEVGIPISYDGMREIPLPYSKSAHEQLLAVQALGHSEIITGHVSMHLTVGGFDHLDSNVLLLHQMAVASGLFEENIKLNEDFHPLDKENIIWAKRMIEGDESSPSGMPIRLRWNDSIEFRWLIGRTRNFSKTAKGIDTFVQACEALAAWQKVYDQPFTTNPSPTQKDLDLANVWIRMKSEGLDTFESFGIPSKSVDMLYKDAEAYARHETEIRSHVITTKYMAPDEIETNANNKKRMYSVFRDARAKVKAILKPT